MVIAGIISFLLLIRGAEQTMIPDVRGMELENALIELQEKELNARIQLHYSSNPEDKGTILGQEPNPGSLVKAGRKITLKVSRGAILDRVENYIGWDLTDLEIHLRTLFTTYGPLIRIKTPVIRVFDESPGGTILEQKPLPDTPISGVTELELVVSRGAEEEFMLVEKYIDMDFQMALERLAAFNIPFIFISRDAEGQEVPGTIVSQTPAEDTSVPAGTYIQLTMTRPEEIEEGYTFGILKKTLPDYPIAVDMRLDAVSLQGEKRTIFTMKHPGGVIAIPYLEEENTLLILSVFDEEIIRYTVRPQELQE
jgi:beta-lactam-binding protein with PASTA domain